MKLCVTACGVQEAIEIHEFDGIEIDESEADNASSRQSFRNNRSHATGSNNPNT